MLDGDWLLVASLIASGFTLIGGLLMYFPKAANPRFNATNLLLAALAMIGVSAFELIPSSISLGFRPVQLILGLGIGFAMVLAIELLARVFEHAKTSRETSSAWIVAIALILHNIPEGSATVSAAQADAESALFTAGAIGLHNIPEGLTIAAVAMAARFSQAKIWLLVAISALAETAGTLTVWLNRELLAFERQSGFILLVVAGLMIAISTFELLPSAFRHLRPSARTNQKH